MSSLLSFWYIYFYIRNISCSLKKTHIFAFIFFSNRNLLVIARTLPILYHHLSKHKCQWKHWFWLSRFIDDIRTIGKHFYLSPVEHVINLCNSINLIMTEWLLRRYAIKSTSRPLSLHTSTTSVIAIDVLNTSLYFLNVSFNASDLRARDLHPTYEFKGRWRALHGDLKQFKTFILKYILIH